MGIFSNSKEEEEDLQDEKDQEAYNKIILFPGSVREYEGSKGYEVEIIDTERRNKGVMFISESEYDEDTDEGISGYDTKSCPHEQDCDLVKELIEKGLEALVNVQHSVSENSDFKVHHFYGLPIRKKTVTKDTSTE